MTFGPNHYVPVLKVKPAEKAALAGLPPLVAAHITPVLEIIENKSGKTTAQHLDLVFRGLVGAVDVLDRYFLDCREIAPAGPAAAADVFARAGALGRPFTPVTGISRTADVGAAMAVATGGLAIRLTREEFETGSLPGLLHRFMAAHGLTPERVDLLVDIGAVDQMLVVGVSRLSAQFLGVIPDKLRWRTLSLLASAFPLGLGGVGRDSHDFADRTDWVSWRDSLHLRRGTMERLPTFGDCAIQHPRGVEGLDFRKVQMSASIRYTLPEQWLLVKGESTRTTLPSIQFPRLAAKLTAGALSGHFAGEGHCSGCRSIVQAAAGAPKLASLGAWRMLGTVHHLTRTSEQIRALVWP